MSVTELPRTATDIDVVVAFTSIERGTSKIVEHSKNSIIAVHHLEVNGHYFWPEVAKLRTDGFLALEISAKDYEPVEYRQRHIDEIEALRSELTPDDWLWDSDEDTLYLPVSTIRWQRHQYA